jgi:hypothetical protein
VNRTLAARAAKAASGVFPLKKIANLIDWQRLIPDAFANVPQFPDRPGLFRHVRGLRPPNDPITYLEFGVYRGASMRQWLSIDQHPDSRFAGFDTFTGLPEDWTPQRRAGHFTAEGKPPDIPDPRVTFLKGLFSETLPGYLRAHPVRPPVIVNIDCDLYGGALYVLTTLDSLLPSGSIVLFDEFYDLEHEFAAFRDYLLAFGRPWRAVAMTAGYIQVAIELQ